MRACVAGAARKSFARKGEWPLAQGAPVAMEAAESLFQRSLDTAKQQGALAWELRAAMSLTRLWFRRARPMHRHWLLYGILQQFTEGHAKADLREAGALLESCNGAAAATAMPAQIGKPSRRRQQP